MYLCQNIATTDVHMGSACQQPMISFNSSSLSTLLKDDALRKNARAAVAMLQLPLDVIISSTTSVTNSVCKDRRNSDGLCQISKTSSSVRTKSPCSSTSPKIISLPECASLLTNIFIWLKPTAPRVLSKAHICQMSFVSAGQIAWYQLVPFAVVAKPQ